MFINIVLLIFAIFSLLSHHEVNQLSECGDLLGALKSGALFSPFMASGLESV
jgi:hypothetical protein